MEKRIDESSAAAAHVRSPVVAPRDVVVLEGKPTSPGGIEGESAPSPKKMLGRHNNVVEGHEEATMTPDGGGGADTMTTAHDLSAEVSRLTQQLQPGKKHPAVVVGAGEKLAAALRASTCTPAAVDAALAGAGTAAAVVAVLEHAADTGGQGGEGGGEGGGGGDVVEDNAAAAAAAADVIDAAISKTFRRASPSSPSSMSRDAGEVSSSSTPETTTTVPGEVLAAFCLLGGLPAALSLLHPRHSPRCRIAAARVLRTVARGGGVGLRCLVSCNGLDALGRRVVYYVVCVLVCPFIHSFSFFFCFSLSN